MRFILLMMFVLPLLAYEHRDNQVCLIIDQDEIGHEKYPNLAINSDNSDDNFYIFHKQIACFDLGKVYYLQQFLEERDQSIVYDTTCFFVPLPSDDGKILRFEGNGEDAHCPISDEFHIE